MATEATQVSVENTAQKLPLIPTDLHAGREPPAQRHGNDTPSSDTAVASALGQPSEQGGPQRGGVEALDTHQVPHENDVQVSQASQDATTAIEAKPSEAAPLSEFDRQLQKAEADLTNFAQWVAVEKLLEKEGSIEKTRRLFDGFLAEFPLCYAYWKKYADLEHKHSSPEWAINVFDRGTAAVPYSCDLWGHYCTYLQKIGKPADEIRRHFEQGVAYVGTDFLAHVLWDKYIKFEVEQGAFANVAHLYLQILSGPIRELPRYHSSFKTFASGHQAAVLMSPEELSKIRATLLQAKQSADTERKEAAAAVAKQLADAAAQPTSEGASVKGEPTSTSGAAEVAQPEVGGVGLTGGGEVIKAEEGAADGQGGDAMEIDAPEAADKEVSVGVTDEEVKAFWLSGVDAVVEESTAELARRRVFEDFIKRPYFHVKPLPPSQLQAWDSYIDYILKKDDAGSIVRLFERCLVACANYPEFWMRYIRYQEQGGPNGVEGAKPILQRAQQVFCKASTSLQLFAVKFHERTGDMEAARRTYGLLGTLAPGLAEAVVQAANFERRQDNLTGACKAFDEALAQEEAKEGVSEDGATLAMFYARFLFLDCSDAIAARTVYTRALEKWPTLRPLWEGALHFEEHCLADGRTERVLDLYRRATGLDPGAAAPALEDADREVLGGRMLDFADRLATPALAAQLEALHAAAFPKQWGAGGSKRAAESAAGDPPIKRVATSQTEQPTGLTSPAFPPAQPAAASVSGAPAAVPSYGYQDPAAAFAQPVASGAPQAGYYPQTSAGYGYGYQYPYGQDYGYSYAGYQQ